MKRLSPASITLLVGIIAPVFISPVQAQELPSQETILENMRLANRYFMEKWPDVGRIIVTNKSRPSNIWTRAVYYEGLMALYGIDQQQEYYQYAVDWGESRP